MANVGDRVEAGADIEAPLIRIAAGTRGRVTSTTGGVTVEYRVARGITAVHRFADATDFTMCRAATPHVSTLASFIAALAFLATLLLPAVAEDQGQARMHGTLYVGAIAPGSSSVPVPHPGDLWYDTTAALLKKCAASPCSSWTSVEGGSGGGTPADTVAALDGAGAAGTASAYSRGDHRHADASRPTSGEKAALAGTAGTPSGTNTYATDQDARLSDARTPTAHSHPEADVTGLVSDLAGKAAVSHAHAEADVTGLVTDLAARIQLGGQLGGTATTPDVRGLRETAGPTLLTLGNVADGQFVKREGATLVGAAAGGGTAALVLQGHWTEFSTKSNIGTSYVDLYTTAGSVGLPCLADFAGRTIARLVVQWNKIGTGTQSVRAVDADNVANVLIEMTVVADGNDSGEVALPAWATGVKRIKLQAKSTTSTDDPVFRGAALYVK